MRSSGIVRKVDNLGRIVIPIEIRRALSIEIKDPIEIALEGDSIILKRQCAACALCGSAENVRKVGEKYICAKCIENVKGLL